MASSTLTIDDFPTYHFNEPLSTSNPENLLNQFRKLDFLNDKPSKSPGSSRRPSGNSNSEQSKTESQPKPDPEIQEVKEKTSQDFVISSSSLNQNLKPSQNSATRNLSHLTPKYKQKYANWISNFLTSTSPTDMKQYQKLMNQYIINPDSTYDANQVPFIMHVLSGLFPILSDNSLDMAMNRDRIWQDTHAILDRIDEFAAIDAEDSSSSESESDGSNDEMEMASSARKPETRPVPDLKIKIEAAAKPSETQKIAPKDPRRASNVPRDPRRKSVMRTREYSESETAPATGPQPSKKHDNSEGQLKIVSGEISSNKRPDGRSDSVRLQQLQRQESEQSSTSNQSPRNLLKKVIPEIPFSADNREAAEELRTKYCRRQQPVLAKYLRLLSFHHFDHNSDAEVGTIRADQLIRSASNSRQASGDSTRMQSPLTRVVIFGGSDFLGVSFRKFFREIV